MERFVLFHTLFCWRKPSSVLESNNSLPTGVSPTRLTKVGRAAGSCFQTPGGSREGRPFLPDVPRSLKGPGASLLCQMEDEARTEDMSL